MAAPTVGNINGSNSGTQVASVVAAMPAGAASGDLIGYAVITDAGVSAPSTGWTELTEVSTPGGNAALAVGYRRLTGGAQDTLTLTFTGSSAYCYETFKIIGAHASTAPEAGGSASGTSTTPNALSFNPTGWDVEDTLWLAIAGWDGTPNRSLDPSGWTFVADQDNNSATFGSGLTVWKKDSSPDVASEDPGAWTLTGSTPWAALVMAFRPAAVDITKSLTAVTESSSAVAMSYGRALSITAVTESSAAVAQAFQFTPASTGRPPRLGRRRPKVGLH